jgi:hypothetical protein
VIERVLGREYGKGTCLRWSEDSKTGSTGRWGVFRWKGCGDVRHCTAMKTMWAVEMSGIVQRWRPCGRRELTAAGYLLNSTQLLWDTHKYIHVRHWICVESLCTRTVLPTMQWCPETVAVVHLAALVREYTRLSCCVLRLYQQCRSRAPCFPVSHRLCLLQYLQRWLSQTATE